MSRKAKVQAYDVKDKVMVDMLDPKPVYSIRTTATGKEVKTYRLAGLSASGHKLSKIVGQAEAAKYGTPKKVEAKARAPKKSCKVKYDECEAKAATKGKRGKKAAAEPLEEKVEDLEEAVEEVKKTAKKAGAKAKTARAKKAVKDVVDIAEQVEEKVDEISAAVQEVKQSSPKKPGRKPAAKGAKKPAARKPAAKGGKKPAKGKK